ncbi:2-keto-3-deoxygluconate kinase [Sporosarcina newyorkensis 2681]|uniref:2-keto-3-deoxygluconate kinase n=1 Tax=Sporosarcina newyorkensis 2681 TaxID=1027292 RepID=F9DRS4_9BACL|nr:sugar kinase [Sporosarcina newyorkensis]EGQ26477.1 2-keto-3-deoxygluconate kinase [Sporosarcina newyorkensis 2681]
MDVVTIGDALITMNPLTNGPLRFVNTFERKVGGAELNVAIGCARLGLETGWVSRLGNDEFGRYAKNFIRGEGVDVSQVSFVEGSPTSVYFKEILDGDRINSYYYRANSPTDKLVAEEIDEAYIQEAKVVHITGVFPSINETNREVVLQILKIAKKSGVLVTFDPNIRLKLWTAERAKECLTSFLPYVDVLLTGEEEAQLLFGTSDLIEIVEEVKPHGITHVVLKKGKDGAVGYRDQQMIQSPAISTNAVVDTIGAGDGFASGYIYSLIQNWQLDQSLRFANAVASYVISVPGDNEGLPYLEDMEILLGKKKRVER